MAKTRAVIRDVLKDLLGSEFENFKRRLWNGVSSEIPPISRGRLENAEREDVVDYMVKQYGTPDAGNIAVQALRLIQRNELANRLERKLEEVSDDAGADDDAGDDAAVAVPSSASAATAQTPGLSVNARGRHANVSVINNSTINGNVTVSH